MRVAHDLDLSRRTQLAGSTMAFAMTLPAGLIAQARTELPVLVRLSWGEGEGDQAIRGRMISAIFRALREVVTDPRSTWVLADA